MGRITADIEERQRRFAEALKAEGLRLTHQRLEVIREISSADHHPGAEEVYRAVRRRVPTISLDTVYRTLGTLQAHGLVQRIDAKGASRYDPDLSPHHHFVCSECGDLTDVPADLVGPLDTPRHVRGVGDVTGVRLELKGVCTGCASAK